MRRELALWGCLLLSSIALGLAKTGGAFGRCAEAMSTWAYRKAQELE